MATRNKDQTRAKWWPIMVTSCGGSAGGATLHPKGLVRGASLGLMMPGICCMTMAPCCFHSWRAKCWMSMTDLHLLGSLCTQHIHECWGWVQHRKNVRLWQMHASHREIGCKPAMKQQACVVALAQGCKPLVVWQVLAASKPAAINCLIASNSTI